MLLIPEWARLSGRFEGLVSMRSDLQEVSSFVAILMTGRPGDLVALRSAVDGTMVRRHHWL